ncbi:MAG: riboflavin biosynthesis protein RibF, partial [Bdellovibrionales bacterium]
MKKIIIDFKDDGLTPKKTLLTLGCFDGIHKGHQEIIKELQKKAKEYNLKSCLCVFDPHPFQVLNPSQEFKRLFLVDEIEKILAAYSLDYFCIIPFNLDFSKLSPKDFIHSFIKKQFDPFEIIVGYDFSFGFEKKGDISYLKKEGEKLGFKVTQISKKNYHNETVSSSIIKKKLSEGLLDQVMNFLGRPFGIKARVIQGESYGRRLGFPTANLDIKPIKQLPKKGVYACKVSVSGGPPKKAVMNIGTRPTLSSQNKTSTEVH